MKKSIRLTAAAMAAISAISCASFASFADNTPKLTSDLGIAAEINGGWTANSGSVSMSKNAAAKAAFKKATEDLLGVSYKAIALLGTQVVAGTNYAILCKSTVVYPDAEPEMVILYIYEDLEGNAEITGTQTILSGGEEEGGFTVNTGKLSPSKNKTVYSAYKAAMKKKTDVSYKPVVYLGKQVVSGMNYMILCRSNVSAKSEECEWVLVTVNKDLEGKCSVVDTEAVELGNTDDSSETVQIPNPWQEYSTVSEAAKAAGVSFNAPEKLGNHKISYIQAMDGIAEVDYTKGENTICVRAGAGTDDISGDYNTYKNVSEKKIGGYTVTLKGNSTGYKAAVWTDGKYSYSVYSDNELTERFMTEIIGKLA